MDRKEARRILLCYRTGTDDDSDPQFAEALALARTDGELGEWLHAHNEAYRRIRSTLERVEPPAGLKEKILSHRPLPPNVIPLRPAAALAAIAALIVLFIGLADWLNAAKNTTDFPAYRNRMARSVIRNYRMDILTNNPVAIRQFLGTRGSPADYELSAPMAETTPIGCAVIKWQNHPVSMLCFEADDQRRVWLFVADKSGLPGAPGGGAPQIVPISRLLTASWSDRQKNYLLAVEGDEQFLRRFL